MSNPQVYFQLASNNILRFLMGYQSNAKIFATFKERFWRDILQDGLSDQTLIAKLRELNSSSDFLALKELVARYLNTPINKRSKLDIHFVEIVKDMQILYNKLTLRSLS